MSINGIETSTVSIRFDALHVGEGELRLDLTIYQLTSTWGLIRGNGAITRSLDPPIPDTTLTRIMGMYQHLNGDIVHFHLSGQAVEQDGRFSQFHASAAVDSSWGGRGTFDYAGFDAGPCVITRIK